MKVLLVVKSKKMENLGVMYLKSIIQHDGKHKCKIVDLEHAYETAVEWLPNIIGYSILTGDMDKFKYVDHCIKATNDKKIHPYVCIVGGQDPTFFPEGYKWADEIVKGEAEAWAAFRFNSPLCICGIDNIPWPDRSDFPDLKIRDFIFLLDSFFNLGLGCFCARKGLL